VPSGHLFSNKDDLKRILCGIALNSERVRQFLTITLRHEQSEPELLLGNSPVHVSCLLVTAATEATTTIIFFNHLLFASCTVIGVV
jgi:hypothetical protein